MELSGVDKTTEGLSLREAAVSRVLSREQLARRLAVVTSSNNVQGVMRLLADYVGASHFLLARYDLIQEQGLDFIVTSNWPFDLVRRLGSELASGYARSTELEKCLSLLTPSFALLPDDVTPPDDISRQYCSLTFCVGRTRFSLMLLFLEGTILSQERLREVGLLAAYGASFAESADVRTERDFELTERELECLFWIAEGKTSDEIAVILGISRNTINNYITSVMRKTATKTRSEAIAYAVRNNLV
ncbi:helix-turn-helix transcriptional regulator [Rhizobium sp. YS-1r]|uniref:transcriptional regulator VisN n=1 Tax=Rhizobium sp. YS-1r TaxID=1532558 RepID=UPI00050FDD20|nr:helix-turn-helix transcriptional regulator [Rhizobium sp. YS-1r]KGD86315.1 LuxR family transcriptional regulator [Rhizobium sp. YS-1r]